MSTESEKLPPREMKVAMASILDRIMAVKRREIEAARLATPEHMLEERIRSLPATRDFTNALDRPGTVAVIAEVKKASPSAGVIRADFDPVAIAKTYADHGAAAISVLSDVEFFQGKLDYITAVHDAVPCPVLRKDFILDRYQLLEARAAGADAVLLIAECLPGNELADLQQRAAELGLHTLIELHDADQLPRVLEAGGRVIGINNRDLRSFTTRLDHTLELLQHIPGDRIVVSESGIGSREDLLRLGNAGAKAVLVGESLMRSPDIGAALDLLLGR
jgi:indole-3-glycerol phosphate synthase